MGGEDLEKRDKLLALEDGLCDLQELAVEAGAETTSALLRAAILDVRQASASPNVLMDELPEQKSPRRSGAGHESTKRLSQLKESLQCE
jgi:riboflavin biosynthesis pyrimidine reductase